ncbi:MAG TPA: 3D domain-containing protein [Pyrinomonadaceae bacterium]|jgi:3D (Asp-Asp-Asp) domain-containing protein
MRLFLRGSAAIAAALFACYLTFNAQPLFAETNPSQEPASQQQQQKQEPAAAAAQPGKDSATAPPAATSVRDSDYTAAPPAVLVKPLERPAAAPQLYEATSYSRAGRGASGMGVRSGTIAADPRVLPFGTRVRLDAGPYSGEYLVTDSGSAIKGNKIDIWIPSYREACRFGRRKVKLTVLSYGARRGARAKR